MERLRAALRRRLRDIQPCPGDPHEDAVRSPLRASRSCQSRPHCATQVVDDFESGTNPNQWGWTNGGGGAFTIQPDGGNPGAWLDSGVPYFSDHPNLTSYPPEGSALRDRARERHARLGERRHRAARHLRRQQLPSGLRPAEHVHARADRPAHDPERSADRDRGAHDRRPGVAGRRSVPVDACVSFTIPSGATDVPPRLGAQRAAGPQLHVAGPDAEHRRHQLLRDQSRARSRSIRAGSSARTTSS